MIKKYWRNFSIKKLFPKTLFGRSLLILVTPILLIQIITSVVFFDRHWSKMTTRLSTAVAGEIAWAASSIEADPSAKNIKNVTTFASSHLDLLISYQPEKTLEDVVDYEVGLIWESLLVETLSEQMQIRVRRPFVLRTDFQEKWVSVSVQLENGVMDVRLPRGRLFSSSGYIFLLWMLAVSVVLLVIAVLFMRNQIRPIRRLAIVAERFGKGRDAPSFKPSGAIEVRQATEAFFEMRRRLQRQVSQRTAMLAGVSHDLRTPLTRLKLQLEMLGDSPEVDAMKCDIAEMGKMIDGYLDFVRGAGEEQVVSTDVDALIDRVVMSAKRQGLEIEAHKEDKLSMMIRPLSFERCLSNIINNAAKYGQHIWLTVRRDEDRLEVIVDDDGPGIPEDQYEEVFKPFYRTDSSRNLTTGGVGLGLSIAMDIVHGHGGKIWLDKSPQGGLRVIIRIPL